MREEEKFDGVLRANARFTPGETALRYKQLVEQVFRTARALTRLPQGGRNPGTYFVRFSRSCCGRNCSAASARPTAESKDILGDALTETVQDDKWFVVRSRTCGATGKIFQCVGVKPPNTIR